MLYYFCELKKYQKAKERKRFKELIKKSKENSIILFSTHIVSDIEDVCDRIIIMNKGKIIRQGILEEICGTDAENNLENAYLKIINEGKQV